MRYSESDQGRTSWDAGSTFPRVRATQNSMLDVEFAQVSDPGRIREQNEDCLGYVLPESPAQVRSRGWLFALADGVGGHQQGEVASRAAVESLLAGFRAVTAGESHLALLPRLVQARSEERRVGKGGRWGSAQVGSS